MKRFKNIAVLSICSLMLAAVATGCNDNKYVDPPAETSAEIKEDPCTDATYAGLMDMFDQLTEQYATVSDMLENNEIEANEALDEAMENTANLINSLSETDQADISESRASSLSDEGTALLNKLTAAAEK